MAYLNITSELTPEGIEKIDVGQVLIFDFEGSPVHLKIMRKSGGQIYAKRLDSDKFMTPEQADDQVQVVKNNEPKIEN